MISLLVLYTIHAFIWFGTAICNKVLYSNACLMGNQLHEEDLLVAIISFICYQLNIYGFILYYKCLFFASYQSVHMIMKRLVPSAEFTMPILIGCYRIWSFVTYSPEIWKVIQAEAWFIVFLQVYNSKNYLLPSLDISSLEQDMDSSSHIEDRHYYPDVCAIVGLFRIYNVNVLSSKCNN